MGSPKSLPIPFYVTDEWVLLRDGLGCCIHLWKLQGRREKGLQTMRYTGAEFGSSYFFFFYHPLSPPPMLYVLRFLPLFCKEHRLQNNLSFGQNDKVGLDLPCWFRSLPILSALLKIVQDFPPWCPRNSTIFLSLSEEIFTLYHNTYQISTRLSLDLIPSFLPEICRDGSPFGLVLSQLA